MNRLHYLIWLAVLPVCGFAQNIPQSGLVFESNAGQADRSVQFIARTPGHTMLLLRDGVILKSQSGAVRIQFSGANAATQAEGVGPLASKSNYFLGNRPDHWTPHVAQFGQVRYRNIYDGVDLVYYGNQKRVEYDLVLAAGADPTKIAFAFAGASHVRLNRDGDLTIQAGRDVMIQKKPRVYQKVSGKTVEIASSYRLTKQGGAKLVVAPYDRSHELVVDPVIEFSDYLGGAGYDSATSIAVDANANFYVTGVTNSNTLPTSLNSVQQGFAGESDAFVAKYSSNGTLNWITYLGGRQTDAGNSVKVDATGSVYVSGFTTSFDFPTRNGAQMAYGGGGEDAFVVKLNSTGDQIIYSTYLGGGSDDFGNGLAIDSDGAAYLAGWTRSGTSGNGSFPIVNAAQPNAAGGGADAFVTKISPSGGSFVYSTLIGGNGQDLATGIALDSNKNAYVTGTTSSSNFPTVNAFQGSNGGTPFSTYDAFVTKISPEGNRFIYSTYLGGSGTDQGNRIAVDKDGSAYVSGFTQSQNFPTANAAQTQNAGGTDVFVTKLAADGRSLAYSTYLGGSAEDQGFGDIAVDSSGSAYVTGWTASRDFPIRSGGQNKYGGGNFDAFVTRLSPSGNVFLYSTYLGGSGEDKGYGLALDQVRGNVYVAGQTSSTDFPGARNEYHQGQGGADAFIARIAPDTSAGVALYSPAALQFNALPGVNPASQTVSLSSSSGALSFAAFGGTASGGNWLSVTPATGNTPLDLTVSVQAAGLAAGTYSGTVTVNLPFAGNSPLNIPVTLTVSTTPVIQSVNPTNIAAGAADTTILVNGIGFGPTSQVQANGSALQTTFVDAGTLRAILPQNLLLSPGTLSLTVNNPGTGSSKELAFQVVGNVPFFTVGGVVNAATMLAGPVTPGEIITIYGTGFGPTTLAGASLDTSGFVSTTIAGARVLFDGTPAPLIYVVAGQLAAVVPYSVNQATTSVVIEWNGVRSQPVSITTNTSNPGVFTQNSSGRGQASVLNQGGTLNSVNNPALRGSTITFFATGEGQTMPQGISGLVTSQAVLPRPVQPVTLKIGGMDATVTYAGAAPGQVAGVLQVNAIVPSNAPVGANVPLVLTIGNSTSRGDVTIAIQ